jgi:hypothetical protein
MTLLTQRLCQDCQFAAARISARHLQSKDTCMTMLLCRAAPNKRVAASTMDSLMARISLRCSVEDIKRLKKRGNTNLKKSFLFELAYNIYKVLVRVPLLESRWHGWTLRLPDGSHGHAC